MLKKLLGDRGGLWKIGHAVYEVDVIRKVLAPVVNSFKPDWVINRGHKVFIDKNDRVISLQLIIDGKWEDKELDLFEKFIKPGDIVVDVGANIGLYTLVAARKVGPNGKVYAFEPDLNNFKLLSKNIAANGYKNVVAINKAVGEKKGSGKLYMSKEDNYGDLTTYNPQDGRKEIKVETVTIDETLKGVAVTMIKIDIQGSEVKALKGAAKILKRQKKMMLFSEFWPRGLKLCGNSGAEYLKILNDNGFKMQKITDLGDLKAVNPKNILKEYPDNSMYNADIVCVK